MSDVVRRVVIVGGNATAWLAAAALLRAFRHRNIEISVADSGVPGDTPVGHWTLPSQRGMHSLIGIGETEFMRRTGATFKLASEHAGWQGAGSNFLHVHGEIGSDLGGTPFYKYLQKQAIAGQTERAEHYCVAAVAARNGRFARPMGADKSLTAGFTYGYHLEARPYVDLLRAHALGLGARPVMGRVTDLLPGEDGRIAAVLLDSGEQVAGDLFLDCTGREALLMSRLGATERDSWSEWLPCDRMWSAMTAASDAPAPLTRTTAARAGWLWWAPLAQSSMIGYVFSGAHLSDAEALHQLRQMAPATAGEPIMSRFAAGKRREFWRKNCVALGDAAIELEPLAGADLHLAQLGLGTLIELFPLTRGSNVEAVEYNRVMGEHADAVRDFTVAHYRSGRMPAGDFWAATRATAAPARLAHKLDLYAASGRIGLLDFESFEEVDWAWLLLGSGLVPEALEMQVHMLLEKMTPAQMVPLRTQIQRLASSMPRHIDYVRHLAGQSARPPRH
jgi:tryptophan halogenase